MTITLTPELEQALTTSAQRQGTTPELLALDTLKRFYILPELPKPDLQTGTLLDALGDLVGAVEGSGETLSKNGRELFTRGLVEKQKKRRPL